MKKDKRIQPLTSASLHARVSGAVQLRSLRNYAENNG